MYLDWITTYKAADQSLKKHSIQQQRFIEESTSLFICISCLVLKKWPDDKKNHDWIEQQVLPWTILSVNTATRFW